MIAYPVKSLRPLEGGLKYLVLSAVASAFLLFGMALTYSQSGSLGFSEVGAYFAVGGSQIAMLGGAMLVIGLGFKLSLVPFHLWTPDVYERSGERRVGKGGTSTWSTSGEPIH